MQIIIFFLLGLLSFPSQLPSIAVPAILIALFMTIIARPLSVFAIMAPFKSRWRQQVQMDISEKDSWNGKVIKDLPIPHDTLVAAILRDDKAIIPSGRTKILPGDKIIMSARDFEDENIMQLLSERRIERGSEWIGKKVFQYSPDSNELIVLIKRGNRAIIPRGNTVIHKNDVMVINKIRRESLQTDPAPKQ